MKEHTESPTILAEMFIDSGVPRKSNGIMKPHEIDKEHAKNVIHQVASNVKDAYCKCVDAEAERMLEMKCMSEHSLALLTSYIDAAKTWKEERKQVLSDIREYRMAITNELSLIESATKKIQSLNLAKTAQDIDVIAKSLSNPALKHILKAANE